MKVSNSVLYNRNFSVGLILSGILFGLFLAILSTWADYEASSYGFMRRAQAPFQGLSCPVFMGKNESRTVSIKVSNPTEQTIFPGILTQISTPQEFDSNTEHVQLEPGEQLTLRKTVGPENIDFGFFIFVDAQVSATYPIPARENICGILILPFGNGTLLLIAGTLLSLSLMAFGLFLLYKNKASARRPDSVLFLVVATLIAMSFSFMGWWLQSLVVIVILLLTLLLTAGSYFQWAK